MNKGQSLTDFLRCSRKTVIHQQQELGNRERKFQVRKLEREKIKRLQECAADSNTEHEQKKLMTELAILTERERIEETTGK